MDYNQKNLAVDYSVPVHQHPVQHRPRRRNYQPTATKPWTLAFFLGAILTCLVLLELASRHRPDMDNFAPITTRDVANIKRVFYPRQDVTAQTPDPTSVLITNTPDPTDILIPDTPTTVPGGGTTTPGGGNNGGGGGGTTPTPQPSPVQPVPGTSPVVVVPGPTSAAASTNNPNPSVPTTSGISGNGVNTVVAGTTAPPTLVGSQGTTVRVVTTLEDGTVKTTTAVVGTNANNDSDTDATAVTGDAKSFFSYKDYHYFMALYLPTLIALILSSSWAIIYAAIKMMEPFYQLSRPTGADGKTALMTEYLSSSFNWLSPATAMEGHWVPVLSSLVYMVMILIVPLAGESMTIQATALCNTPVNPAQPCAPQWVVNVTVLRVLEAMLALVFILVFAITLLSLKRESGISSNPSSIANMGDLLGHQPFLNDLRSLQAMARRGDVKNTLHGQTYKLSEYRDMHGRLRYGIVKVSNHSASDETTASQGYAPVTNPDSGDLHARSRPFIFWRDVGMILLTLGLFSVVLAYRLITDPKSPFNLFFNTRTFGSRFLLNLSAVLILTGWKQLDREIRVMEPWRLMSHEPAPAEKTILTTIAGTAWSGIVSSVRLQRWSLLFISSLTVISDCLVIAVQGVPSNAAQFWSTYLIHTYVTLALLVLLFIGLVLTIFRRRSDPPIPRDPDNLAHVWLYLCEGRLNGTENNDEGGCTREEIRERHAGMIYSFGYYMGNDGVRRWMIT